VYKHVDKIRRFRVPPKAFRAN